jgi:hypothetical protein
MATPYITLNRDSAEYAIVRGTLNSGASWGSRPRVSFDYQSEQHELGYIPVSVDKQHPWNADVCHELTAFGAGCTVLPGLLFLVSLVWFLYHIRRKRQSSRLTLRKSRRHRLAQ